MDKVRHPHPAMGRGCGGQTSLGCSSSLAQEFAALASMFRRRLDVGTTMAAAVGATLGRHQVPPQAVPELGRSLRLDVLYPTCGFTRCLNSSIDSTCRDEWPLDSLAAARKEAAMDLPPPLASGPRTL